MSKKAFVLLLGTMIYCWGFSQTIAMEVIGSAGGLFQSSVGSSSWTVGEISTESIETSSGGLTQGFQQDFGTLIVERAEPVNLELNVFPNPTQERVKVEGVSRGQIQLMDLSGQELYKGEINSDGHIVELSHLPSGIYLLKVYDSISSQTEIVKVIKQ